MSLPLKDANTRPRRSLSGAKTIPDPLGAFRRYDHSRPTLACGVGAMTQNSPCLGRYASALALALAFALALALALAHVLAVFLDRALRPSSAGSASLVFVARHRSLHASIHRVTNGRKQSAFRAKFGNYLRGLCMRKRLSPTTFEFHSKPSSIQDALPCLST